VAVVRGTTIELRNGYSGRLDSTLPLPPGLARPTAADFTQLALAPDGSALAFYCATNPVAAPGGDPGAVRDNGVLCLYDLTKRQVRAVMRGGAPWAFSLDGSRIATWKPLDMLQQHAAQIWDARDGRQLSTLPVGPPLALAPDGLSLAGVGKSDHLEVWTMHETLYAHGAGIERARATAARLVSDGVPSSLKQPRGG
jgi:hypothetical protein